MAVAFRHLAISGFRPKETSSTSVLLTKSQVGYGAQWMADNYPDAIRADYVLTENGGLHGGPSHSPSVSMNVGEKELCGDAYATWNARSWVDSI